ncbi:DsrE family protein [Sulfuricurvum sp.]|uniref:DsrE family protein n=1 Tax=Sulfuricurvum sp. TaxID=2025608 RepID=UPI003BB1D05D
MRYLFILFYLLSALVFADTQKIMIDLKTGDMDSFTTRFIGGVSSTADYFIAQGDTVSIAVVIHGEAYKFFVENLERTQYGVDQSLVANQEVLYQKLLEFQKKYNVVLEICQVGMNKKGILSEDIYPFVTPIKSSMTGLVKWQNRGYAYIPVP